MALVTTNIKENFTTDAEFRTFCSAIHAFFVAAGLTQTADSGQINLTTVAKPTAITTIAGYEVWRFSDTDQAAAPIYFKIEYGSNTTAANNPAIFISVGSGSDGAGTLTATGYPGGGTVIARKQLSVQATGASGSATSPCYFDYLADGSGFVMALWPAVANANAAGAMGFVIERFRDGDGTPNADGFNISMFRASSSSGSLSLDGRFFLTGATQPTTNATNLSMPSDAFGVANGSAIMGTVLYPWPIFTGIVPRLGGPSQLLLGIGNNDLATAVTFNMSHYGTSRTWMSLGVGNVSGGGGSIGWGGLSGASGTPGIRGIAIRAD